MNDATAPVWGVWSNYWMLQFATTERPALDGLNGHIVTLDHPDGRREAWKVTGGELTETEARLCSICREKPVGPGGQACPECFTRISQKAATDPYGQTSEDPA